MMSNLDVCCVLLTWNGCVYVYVCICIHQSCCCEIESCVMCACVSYSTFVYYMRTVYVLCTSCMFLDYACARFMQFLCPNCAPLLLPLPRECCKLVWSSSVCHTSSQKILFLVTLYVHTLDYSFDIVQCHMFAYICLASQRHCTVFLSSAKRFPAFVVVCVECSDTLSQPTTHLTSPSLVSLSLLYLVHLVMHNLLQGLFCNSWTIDTTPAGL